MDGLWHAARRLRRAAVPALCLAVTLAVSACDVRSEPTGTPSPEPTTGASLAATPSGPRGSGPDASLDAPDAPDPRMLIVDTDVAPDDIVALAFLLSAPNVTVVAITVSGTGEARCAGGVSVVLSLLERLRAAEIPVACGRTMPLAGDHAFPDAWRDAADSGSGLALTPTTRVPDDRDAVALIDAMAAAHEGVSILTLGPLTNLADALVSPEIAEALGPVYVMGGALHVPGNLRGPGAPTGNDAAEWNIYVDPRAAQLVVDAGLDLSFVSLDGTSQVPVTPAFGQRAIEAAATPAGQVLSELFTANPFMTDGTYFLWDPLAAQLAAGYAVGTFSDARIAIEQTEGPESGFTRPTDGESNIQFLSAADPAAAEATLLSILNAR